MKEVLVDLFKGTKSTRDIETVFDLRSVAITGVPYLSIISYLNRYNSWCGTGIVSVLILMCDGPRFYREIPIYPADIKYLIVMTRFRCTCKKEAGE